FSVTGFGGQGKTYLALETGYWLLRTGLFQRVCFVSFSGFQGVDPVGVTISTLATVLDESLPDAEAAEAALKRIPTLLILDNLESLADEAGLPELLTAATRWSEAGKSRVLLTSRQPDFNHPDYHTAGTFEHQCLHLKGLGQQDALDWFGELMRLPPEPKFGMPQRSALIDLFHKVGFHPLSIGLLAQQLKERRPAELGERLEALLEEQPADREDRTLLASLELSIERLPARCQEWLPRLGVFQGGCLEEMIGKVTGLDQADWQELRNHLLRAGLMQAERVPMADKIFLRFHTTLAPALWQKLTAKKRAGLLKRYCQTYYLLSIVLYQLDEKAPRPTRALAQCELPNLFRAVHTALQEGKTEESVDFAANVNTFLYLFGMRCDSQKLTKAVDKAWYTVDLQTWFRARSNLGEQLWQNGQIAAAVQVFEDIFDKLEKTPSFKRCQALGRLGCCYRIQGTLDRAEQFLRQALYELAQLEQSEEVRQQTGFALTDLADLLTEQGCYKEADEAYQAGLEIAEEQGNARGIAVIKSQLGTLALRQGKLTEAIEQYQSVQHLFRSIGEPASEATLLHQLGIVHQLSGNWKQAEQVYREAAQLIEEMDGEDRNIQAGRNWQSLAQICAVTGREAEAEQWYRKALAACRAAGDQSGMALILNNLATLLINDSTRLTEAYSLAENSLTIQETLEPAAVEIWKVYEVLSQIANKQGDSLQAAEYRTRSKQAYFAFPGWRKQLYQYEELIASVVQASRELDVREKLEQAIDKVLKEKEHSLFAAILPILKGECDEAALFEPLNYTEAAIIRAILEGIDEKA
ncbi:MAG: tetratricopeptide repeat protein, partial [Candidatus Electrothrix sp. AW1]|nr:tetratricopeptide repeat protein [Candidatus Electrothrix gigas]